MRIALAHEWITGPAGSEQVFAALADLFPDADLFALTRAPSADIGLGSRHVRTTFLDRPQLRERRAAILPLMPVAWQSLGRQGYDLVISSHHSFSISNRLAEPGGAHVAYVHSPARYLWTPEIDARGAGWTKAVPRALLRPVERRSAGRLHAVAANSQAVRDRIERYWGRVSEVIHPPVRVEYFGQKAEPALDLPENYLLSHGRWVPYKGHLLAIDAARHAGMPLVISGRGPEEQRLRARAAEGGPPVLFVRSPTTAQVRELMTRAAALIFPADEDFGITPVEAQAAGTPVVALGRGGSLETVRHGFSGIHVPEATGSAFGEAVTSALTLDARDCRAHAATFSGDAFRRRILDWLARSGFGGLPSGRAGESGGPEESGR